MFLQVLFALNQTLLQHESLRAGSLQAPYTTEDLIKHYNCGDLNAVIFNHDTSQVGKVLQMGQLIDNKSANSDVLVNILCSISTFPLPFDALCFLFILIYLMGE